MPLVGKFNHTKVVETTKKVWLVITGKIKINKVKIKIGEDYLRNGESKSWVVEIEIKNEYAYENVKWV